MNEPEKKPKKPEPTPEPVPTLVEFFRKLVLEEATSGKIAQAIEEARKEEDHDGRLLEGPAPKGP